MTMQRLRFEIKNISEEGTFEGLLSPYGNIDQGGDIVQAGAYDKNLKEQGAVRPLLWQHKVDVPIGQISLESRPEGLWAKGKLLLALEEAQRAYVLIKAGIVKGLSIGYDVVKKDFKDGVRQLKEIKLLEGSIVTFPMNEMALISSVKHSETKDDFNEELADVQASDAPYQMRCALFSALDSAMMSGVTFEQIISATETVLQQFSDAYMAWLPGYLDMLAQDGGSISQGMEMMERRRLLQKASGTTKRVDGVDLTADCFAYVGEPEKTDTWKLPIKFPGDEEKTKRHIQNALARFNQTQGIPSGERDRVLAKIQAAASRYGIDVAKAIAEGEIKEGRVISAANMNQLSAARDHMRSAHDIVSALLDNSAGYDSTPKGAGTDTTEEPKAASATTSEPDELHSMVESFDAKLKAIMAA